MLAVGLFVVGRAEITYIVIFTIMLSVFVAFVFFIILGILALIKYLRSKDVRQEKTVIRKSLGGAIKAHRIEHKMTQEFVAETLGVSRQAISKWENGTSDPSTSNLIALAKLFGISGEDLLKEIKE